MTSDSYPYPVMSSSTDDYQQNKVSWSDPEISEVDGSVVIRISVEIQDDVISRLVNDGLAYPSALVYCGTTNYRRFFPIEDIEVDKTMIAGEVYIEPSICALDVIDNYSNPGLSEDYEGVNITVPKGGFIAMGDQFKIYVSRQEPPEADSICKFESNGEGREDFREDDEYITIMLPEEIYKEFRNMDNNYKAVFSAIHVPPVIEALIEKYWKSKVEPEDRLWSRVMKAAIDERFPPNESGDQLVNYSSYQIMTAIIGPMLLRGSDNLFEIYTMMSKEDY